MNGSPTVNITIYLISSFPIVNPLQLFTSPVPTTCQINNILEQY